MGCGYGVYQGLGTYGGFPAVDFHDDVRLATPELEWPRDGANLCEEPYDHETKARGDSTGIDLKWKAVPGATQYIVQWSQDSSFNGPTLRSEKVAGTTKSLKLGEDIRMGEEAHWRVMASNSTGGTSHKSESRSFKYDCPQSKRKNPKGDDSSGLCDIYNVEMELQGDEVLHCCDRALYILNMSYDCKDDEGNVFLEYVQTLWTIRQNPADAGNWVEKSDDAWAIIGTKCNTSSQFWLVCCAQFKIVETGQMFLCCVSKQVVVNCDTHYTGYMYPGSWYDGKPWLKIDDRTGKQTVIVSYPDPRWRRSPTGTYAPESTYGKSPLGGSNFIAVGPCIQIREKRMKNPPRDRCKIDPGKPLLTAWQAQVHLPIPWKCEYIRVGYPCTTGLLCQDDDIAIDVYPYCGLTLFTVDPGSITLSASGSTIYLSMEGEQWGFQRTCLGLLLGACDPAGTWQVEQSATVDCTCYQICYCDGYNNGIDCYECLTMFGLI
jgi:hypothetical protein